MLYLLLDIILTLASSYMAFNIFYPKNHSYTSLCSPYETISAKEGSDWGEKRVYRSLK